MSLRSDYDHLFDRIRWYTQPVSDRDKVLAYARELERIAAELQECADELRRLA